MSVLDLVLKKTNARERGVQDGNQNFPPTGATSPSETEEAVVIRCQEETAEAITRLKDLASEIGAKVTRVARDLPGGFDDVLAHHRGALRRIIEDNRKEFCDLALATARLRRDFHAFRYLNERSYEPRYADSLVNFAGVIFLLVVFEAIVNAWFFGQANDGGLVGGFIAAAIISVANVATGLVAGFFALRYFNHIKKLHLVWAFPLLSSLLAIAGFINLTAGHYREALLLDPDAQIIRILPRLWVAPFAVTTFESFVMMCMGVFIFIVALAKGYTVWDTYPGYASRHERWQLAHDDLEDQRFRVRKEFEHEMMAAEAALKRSFDMLRRQKSELQRSSQILEAGLTDLQRRSREIEEAGAAAIATYRNANRRFRRDDAPAYFDQLHAAMPITVPDEILQLQAFAARTGADIAEAENQLTATRTALAALIPTHDAEIKQMIEAADKSAATTLEREAQEFPNVILRPAGRPA